MIERGLLDVHARPETRKLRADVGIGASEARTVECKHDSIQHIVD